MQLGLRSETTGPAAPWGWCSPVEAAVQLVIAVDDEDALTVRGGRWPVTGTMPGRPASSSAARLPPRAQSAPERLSGTIRSGRRERVAGVNG